MVNLPTETSEHLWTFCSKAYDSGGAEKMSLVLAEISAERVRVLQTFDTLSAKAKMCFFFSLPVIGAWAKFGSGDVLFDAGLYALGAGTAFCAWRALKIGELPLLSRESLFGRGDCDQYLIDMSYAKACQLESIVHINIRKCRYVIAAQYLMLFTFIYAVVGFGVFH